MGALDGLAAELMRDNNHFADAFNFALFHGEQVIDPSSLTELDTSTVAVPYNSGGDVEVNKRMRDVFKLLTAKSDGKANYVLLGCENQSHVHYAMPVRNMLYDALQYAELVSQTAKRNRENGIFKDKDITKDEYLSGLLKTDKIHPVITLVIYFGADKWDAPRSLHEMFSIDDERYLKFVPEYMINLITPYDIPYRDFDRFTTDLRKVLLYIKMSSDRKKLKEEVYSHPDYWTVDPATAKLMDLATGTKLKLKPEGGQINMYNAIDEIKEEGRAEGKAEGKAEGILEEKKQTTINLLIAGMARDFISKITGFSLEEIAAIAAGMELA